MTNRIFSLRNQTKIFFGIATIIVFLLISSGPSTVLANDKTHTVAPGETVYAISRLYGVPVADIVSANNLVNANFIKVGQVLTIPGVDGGGDDSSNNPTPTPAPTGEQRTHTVQRGQTLGQIAQLYGVTANQIATANQLLNVNLIYAGQVLVIPGGTTTTAPSNPTPTPAPTQEQPPTTSETTHVVAPGDTIGRIAARYGVTINSIVSANGLFNANLIYVGQVLKIPGASGGGSTTTPTTPPPSGGPVTLNGTVLGGQTHSLANPDRMKDAGMTWVKFQHKWGPGDSANVVQGRITQAHDNGFKVLLSMPGADTYPTSIDFNGYVEFLRGVAALPDPPDAIEVWNEMNIDFEWPIGSISPTSYVNNMLAPAYNAIKGQNSNIMVISGAPAPTGFFGGACTGNGCDDDIYVRQMMAAGASRYMDCMGVHFNAGATSPSATTGHPADSSGHYSWYYSPMVNTYSAAVNRSVPLCFTEVGYLSTNGFPNTPPAFAWAGNTTVDQHAQWLAEAFRLSAADSRVQMFIVFNVDLTFFDPNGDPQAGYAIIRPDGSCPACDTLKAATGG
ncbi:MAG: LysM peptidoglycan-binding domain-containing protein [Chloroflexota bacterium]